MISIMLPRASAAAQRAMIRVFGHTEPSICDPLTAEHFDEAKRGCIEFHHVSFRYPGARRMFFTISAYGTAGVRQPPLSEVPVAVNQPSSIWFRAF